MSCFMYLKYFEFIVRTADLKILKMNQTNNRRSKKVFNISLLLLTTIFLLQITTINSQQVCNKTSDVLECYFCSNGLNNKECSDKDGNSLMNQWRVLKSSPGQDTSGLRYD